METLGVLLVYAGATMLAGGCAGAAWRMIGGRPIEPRTVLRWAGTGALLVIAGAAVPASETRIAQASTSLDRYAPVFQFNEVHEIEVDADCSHVYAAIKATTADEILLFRTLTWLTRLGRPGPESILNAPSRRPLLDVATSTTFLALSEEPGREIVIGTLVAAPPGNRGRPKLTPAEFAAISEPGYAKATMNFLVEEIGSNLCSVRTETRIFATNPSTRRKFAAYWRVIYPGSALIRQMWLRAIRARALSGASKAPR